VTGHFTPPTLPDQIKALGNRIGALELRASRSGILIESDQSGETMPNTGNTDTEFTNPDVITVPVAGDYLIEFGASITPTANAQANLKVTTGLSGGTDLLVATYIGAGFGVAVLGSPTVVTLAAGELRLRGSTNAAAVTWNMKYLKLTSIRVS
jgi:hypothetical protein